MKHERKAFRGEIKYVSLSPHGDPEGIVLDDGSFVKAPPHSLVAKERFAIGALVSGEGGLVTEEPNRVFHHARIQLGTTVLADDSVPKEKRESLKEKHKADLKTRKDAKDEVMVLTGKLVAVATKPKGEVDRLILEDGTSIHVPKEIELWSEDCELGTTFEVRGQTRTYGSSRFVKAFEVRAL